VPDVDLTKAQRRLLRDMAHGAVFYAALNRSVDYMRNDVLFSEGVTIRVWSRSSGFLYCVRNKTAAPLYLNGLVGHAEDTGGDREYFITDAGRKAVAL